MTTYSLFVLMYLSFEDQKKITSFFMDKYQVSPDSIERGMHITIYHSRRPIYSLIKSQSIVSIDVDVKETRFMVLAPGGENPKPNLIPSKRSIGIRLTKNCRGERITEIPQRMNPGSGILRSGRKVVKSAITVWPFP